MFKSARWRSDKNKIKAVFKLQFHATQVAQLGENVLMISLVPGDVGKPTLRLEKAAIQDGCCRWASPVYETVKFVREPKTGKISEKIYHFIVSTGLSKGGSVGEVSIDFADYAEATKPSTVSLPLKNSRSKAVLHVSIQKVQENDDQREIEESENVNIRCQDRSLRTQLSNGDAEESIKSNSAEDKPPSKTPLNALLNGNGRASSGSDITLSSSESGSGLNTPRELGMRESSNHQEPNNFLSSLCHTSVHHKPAENTSTTIYEDQQRAQWEWSAGSDQGISTDDSTNELQDAFSRERSQQASDIEIEKLKSELITLTRQVDVSELELQTLRKQIVKESKRGQDFTREIVSLKEERDLLSAECEKLKSFHKRMDEAKVKNKMQFDGGDPWGLLEEIRQELNYEKELNANLRLQLQKTQESNAELILAVQDLDEMLDQKNKEMSNLSNESGCHETAEGLKRKFTRSKTDDDEEQKALEELVKEHSDAKETYLLEQKIMDLYSEIEIYRRDKDDLEMQMEQLALDYEILKQENHDISYKLEQSQLQEQLKMQYECSSTFANVSELETQIESLENELKDQSKELSDSLATIKELETHINNLEEEMEKRAQVYEADLEAVTCTKAEKQHESLENELKNRSKELSDSLATINELESHIKNLEEDMEKEAQAYEADLEAVTHAKVEQEQRAIRAEETLRQTRWKNANTAERLQEEFRRLSVQMASTFDANEKVAVNDAMKVKLDDLFGCSTFPIDSKQCAECSDVLSEVACMEDSIRALKLKQRQNHEKLAMGKSIPLSLHCKYYLVPSSWLAKWRSYISTSGKNISSSVEPETLGGVINLLKCEKHSRLLERPPELVYKRGSIFQKGATTDGLTIVTENDWKCFCEEWGGYEEKGISAIVEFGNNIGNNLVGSCEEMPICEESSNSRDEENNDIESRQPVVRTFPEICEYCIGEKESCELMEKLNYTDENIYVCLVRGKEAPRSILEASESSFEPDRRTSKRARKTNYGSFINLKVSASTSIYQLKMMIWESLGVVKENQILHKGQKIIEQECATLADMNIFPGDKLWVQDSEIHEHRDIADELSDQRMNVQHEEEGFRGTLLTSNLSSQVV